jgi:ubiquinone/menaquinone biosynthesis C-methylase UbiE
MDDNKSITGGEIISDKIDFQKLFVFLGIRSNSIILDIGCGFGTYVFDMALNCSQGKIFAFYLESEESIHKFMDEILVRAITNIIPKVITPDSLPLGSDTIDICLLNTIFRDLSQRDYGQEVLRETKRVLKPGGTLAVIELKKINSTSGPPGQTGIAPDEFDETLCHAGFIPAIKQEIAIGPYHYLYLYRKSDRKSQ